MFCPPRGRQSLPPRVRGQGLSYGFCPLREPYLPTDPEEKVYIFHRRGGGRGVKNLRFFLDLFFWNLGKIFGKNSKNRPQGGLQFVDLSFDYSLISRMKLTFSFFQKKFLKKKLNLKFCLLCIFLCRPLK